MHVPAAHPGAPAIPAEPLHHRLLSHLPLLFHQRVPLLQTLVLVALPLVGYNTSLLGGLFDVRTAAGVWGVTVINTFSVWIARTLFISIRHDAAQRFGIRIPPQAAGRHWWTWRNVFWVLVSLVLPGVCLGESLKGDTLGAVWWGKLVFGALGGIISGYIIIWAGLWLFMRFLADEHDEEGSDLLTLPFGRAALDRARQAGPGFITPFALALEQPFVMLGRALGPGFLRLEPAPATTPATGGGSGSGTGGAATTPARRPRLTLGHRFALLIFIKAELIGLFFGWQASFATHSTEMEHMHFPTYLYLLLAVNFFGMAAAFLIFTLDRWRVPGLLGIGVILFGIQHSGIDPLDHTYHTRPLPAGVVTPASPRTLLLGPGAPEIPIVVTAEGGGIHAGAWTCHVLATLEMMTHVDPALRQLLGGKTLRESIVCVSGVSGGSYGLLYWLDSYGYPDLKKLAAGTATPAGRQAYADELYRLTRGRAMRPSLDFAVRGLVYHDTRLIPLLQFQTIATDRGYMLEQAWARDLARTPGAPPSQPYAPGLWLSDWTARTVRRELPALLFNATSEERGVPFIFTTTTLGSPENPDPWHYSHWCVDGAGRPLDIPLTAATRCSATFPWVAPSPRAAGVTDPSKAQHLVDGGYFDNTGVMGMVRWLRDAMDISTREESLPPALPTPNKKIIVLRILEGLPAQENTTGRGKIAKGILPQILSPLTSILAVRERGHREEAQNALATLKREARAKGVEIESIDFIYPHPSQPLSWHLTRPQMYEIENTRIDLNIDDLRVRPTAIPAPSTPLPDLSTEAWYTGAKAPPAKDIWTPLPPENTPLLANPAPTAPANPPPPAAAPAIATAPASPPPPASTTAATTAPASPPPPAAPPATTAAHSSPPPASATAATTAPTNPPPLNPPPIDLPAPEANPINKLKTFLKKD